MDYRIEHQKAFSVMGLKRHISFKEGGGEFKDFWREARQGEKAQALRKFADDFIDGMVAITLESNEDDTEVKTMLGYTTQELSAQEDFDIYHYPAASWLVLEVVGRPAKAMRPVWEEVFKGDIIPEGFEMSDLPPFEAYIDADLSSEESKNEIWVGLKNN